MSSALASLGIDKSKLTDQSKDNRFAAVVEGRVAHIDADFIAYQVACETRDELDGLKPRRDLDTMKKQVLVLAEYNMKLVGATSYVLYITPSGSTKGDRPALAVTKPYQGNRAGATAPEFLDAIRHYMATECNSSVSLDQEADDALAQANYEAIAAGTPELSVLMSKDKDLNMVPGYYYDYTYDEVRSLDDAFGYIELYRKPQGKAKSKPAAKLIGRGTKFFWAQCLMGDTADNIAGLPHHGPKNTKVGQVAAFKLLEDCQTDKECYDLVRKLYASSTYEWKHHETQQPCRWGEALYGDMQLLWMRRTKDDRVADFLIEVMAYVPWIEDLTELSEGSPNEG